MYNTAPRPSAEEAFQKLGPIASAALVAAAVTPRTSLSIETPSSLKRRRSATRILSKIGTAAENWTILRKLIAESDEELIVNAAKIGIEIATARDKKLIAQKLTKIESSAPWHLQKDLKDVLAKLLPEVAEP